MREDIFEFSWAGFFYVLKTRRKTQITLIMRIIANIAQPLFIIRCACTSYLSVKLQIKQTLPQYSVVVGQTSYQSYQGLYPEDPNPNPNPLTLTLNQGLYPEDPN